MRFAFAGAARELPLFVLLSRRLQWIGWVERCNDRLRLEFWALWTGDLTVSAVSQAVAEHQRWHNAQRPHAARDYCSPLEHLEQLENVQMAAWAASVKCREAGHAGGWPVGGDSLKELRAEGYGPALTRDNPETIASTRNDALVQDDWNEASYRGARLALSYDINEDWNALLQHTAQTLETEGSFTVEPSLGNESSAKFAPEYNRDEFGLTAWTLTGRLDNLDAVYTGGYLKREVDGVIDYTHHNNGGGYITYYLCGPQNCFDPTKQYREDTKNRRMTHELRVHTDPANRLQLLGGIYYNDMETNHIGDFQYAAANEACAEQNGIPNFQLGNATLPTPGVNATDGPRSPFTVFFNDFTRTEEEVALFGEMVLAPATKTPSTPSRTGIWTSTGSKPTAPSTRPTSFSRPP